MESGLSAENEVAHAANAAPASPPRSDGGRLAPALLALLGFAALIPPALRVAADHAGTLLQPVAVAVILAGAAAGLLAPAGRRQEERLAPLLLAAAVVLAPLLLLVARFVYLLAWPLLGGNDLGVFVLRLALLLGFLLPACCAAGLVLRGVTGREGEDGVSPYRLGMAAAAASVGLALGGAVLLPMLGTRGAAAVGIGLCGAAAAVTALRRQGRGSGQEASSGHLPAVAGDLVLAAAVAGLSLGVAAICWQRTLALLAGPTGAATLIGAAIVLMGLAAGAILMPAAGARGRVVWGMAALAATALLIDTSMFLVPPLSSWCAGLVAGNDGSMTGVLAIVAALVLMLPPSLALGAAAAGLAGAGSGEGSPRPARALGSFVAGTAAGLVLGAAILVPVLGLRRGLALASALGLFALLPLLGRLPFGRPAMKSSASLAVLVAMVVVGGFPAAWDPRVTAGGVYRYAVGSASRFEGRDGWLASRLRGAPPEFYREGRTATVTVEHTVQRATNPPIEAESLLIDGRSIGNTGIDSRSQILAGEIPLLLHGPAENALVIDFSLGLTTGSVLRHPVRSVTAIEREPAVVEAAPIFAALANNPTGDSRLRMVHDDPRARLLADPQQYDVIVMTGTDPWMPHLEGLITDEGYALVRSRLKEKGIAAQRFSLGAASDPLITAWMRSFLKAFPAALLFQTSPDDLLLVGSAADLKASPETIQKTVAAHAAIADDLSRATVIGADEVVLTLRLGSDGLRKMLGDGPSNPDDRRAVTVAAARDLAVQRDSRLGGRIDGAWEGLAVMLDPAGAKEDARAALLYRLAKSYLGLASDQERALSLARDLEGMGATSKARWVSGEARLQQRDVDGALKEWESILETDPDNLDALFSLGMFHFDSRSYFDAERYLGRAAKAHPDTAVVLYNHGRALYQTGRYQPAIETLKQARTVGAGREAYPLVDYFVGLSAARLQRNAEAEKSLKDYLTWAYAQDVLTRVEVDAHLKLAEVLERRGARLEGFQERQKATRLQERIQAYAQSRGQAAGAGAAQEPAADATGAAGTIAPEPPAPGATNPPEGGTPPPATAPPGSAPPTAPPDPPALPSGGR